MAAELRRFVADHGARPFCWKTNNCLGFVSGALQVQGAAPLPREWWSGYGTPRGALLRYRRLLRGYGVRCITEALDARYGRALTLHPADGMICARKADEVMGYAFGVTLAQGCVFLTAQGARWVEPEPGDIFWRPA